MRKTILIILMILFAAACSQKEIKNEFTTEPENPNSGEEITVYFKADSSALNLSEEVTMNAYLFDEEITETIGTEMKNEGNYWKATFKTNPGSKLVIVKFLSGETEETNDGKGFVIYLNKSNPELYAESKANYAAALIGEGRAAGLERDFENAKSEFETLFSQSENLKRKYFYSYLRSLQGADDIQTLQTEADAFTSNIFDLTDEEYYNLYNVYQNILGNAEKAEQLKTAALEKNPNGKFKLLELSNQLRNEADFDKKLILFDEMIKSFPEEDLVKSMYDNLLVQLSRAGMHEKVMEYLEKYGTSVSPYYRFFAARNIVDANSDLALAEKIALNGLQFGKSEYENPTLEKPASSSDKEWKDSRGFEYGMNLFIHGRILHKNGNLEQAAKELKEAVDLTMDYYPQEALNSLYITVLSELGNHDEIMAASEEFIKTGNSSEVILEKLKEAYIAKNNGVKGFDEYMSKYSEMAKELLVAEMKKELINEPAPNFTLTDLEGKEVSLSDFKGKNVIVDFWATWCGPCLNSFPGMKLAQEKLEADGSTKFLFVNTWERVEDKLQNAKDFIAKNNYPFHVLMDTENNVVGEYKVTGIPTKFIIDKEGNIRFRSVGFRGNTQKIVDEIEVMLELIN